MIVRTLPVAEWGRLAQTDLATVCDLLRETDAPAQLFIAEEGPQIVGHFGLFRAWHAEAMWIDPAYRRRGAVMRGLLRQMQGAARTLGVHGVVTAALDDTVEAYLHRLGASTLPGVALVWPLAQKDRVCQSQ